MKKDLLVFLCPLILSACTKATVLSHGRWSGHGERTVVDVDGLSQTENNESLGEDVSFSSQSIGKYRVEGAYLKTVRRDQHFVFQSYVLLSRDQEKSLIRKAQKLEKKSSLLWHQYVSEHPLYKDLRLEEPVQVVIRQSKGLSAVLRGVLIKPSGELVELILDRDGKILSVNALGSSIDEAQTLTLVFPRGPKISDLTQVTISRILAVEGLKNQSVEVGTEGPAKILVSSPLEIQPSDERFDQTQAFYFSSKILNWFAAKKIFTSPLKLQVVTQVGYPEKTNTAFYYMSKIRLGAGDDQIYSRIPWDPSIVMHEVSHAVIDRLAHLPSEGEGGSINEGYADFFTAFYLGNPHMAESSYRKAAYRRTVDVLLKLSERNEGLYHDSSIVSGFYWALRPHVSEGQILELAVRTLNRLGPDANFEKFKLTLNEQVLEIFEGTDLVKVHQVMKERELL